jgi:hypothetical protein
MICLLQRCLLTRLVLLSFLLVNIFYQKKRELSLTFGKHVDTDPVYVYLYVLSGMIGHTRAPLQASGFSRGMGITYCR